jgi:prevent-host-death family protein
VEPVNIRIAKRHFSALVAAAEKGQPTLLTRYGQPCAMIVSVADGTRLYPESTPNIANHLLSLPRAFDAERESTPLVGVDFA